MLPAITRYDPTTNTRYTDHSPPLRVPEGAPIPRVPKSLVCFTEAGHEDLAHGVLKSSLRRFIRRLARFATDSGHRFCLRLSVSGLVQWAMIVCMANQTQKVCNRQPSPNVGDTATDTPRQVGLSQSLEILEKRSAAGWFSGCERQRRERPATTETSLGRRESFIGGRESGAFWAVTDVGSGKPCGRT
jgi:hypothetical protein